MLLIIAIFLTLPAGPVAYKYTRNMVVPGNSAPEGARTSNNQPIRVARMVTVHGAAPQAEAVSAPPIAQAQPVPNAVASAAPIVHAQPVQNAEPVGGWISADKV